jgi:cAMP phosphodiesterase
MAKPMKIKLLPSSFESDGSASPRQHTTCFVIDDVVAIDAGSLGQAASNVHRERLRDVVLTHAHLDHIGGLPLFIDDLFAGLESPVRIHASAEVIEVLERDIFNWSVYPKFSELRNSSGPVVEYRPLVRGKNQIAHLKVLPIAVNHKVPSNGYLIEDGNSKAAITGDTAMMDGFWGQLGDPADLSALLIECAFPDELADLADVSHHLTPSRLAKELDNFSAFSCPIYVINIKPMYRERVIAELAELAIPRMDIFEVGREYSF